MKIQHISTELMFIDPMTKALSAIQYKSHVDRMIVTSSCLIMLCCKGLILFLEIMTFFCCGYKDICQDFGPE